MGKRIVRTGRNKVTVEVLYIGRRMFRSSGFSKRWNMYENSWGNGTDISVQVVMDGVINDIRVIINDNRARSAHGRIVVPKGM